jgi:tRNA(fMet)-specific endonuclease VapC
MIDLFVLDTDILSLAQKRHPTVSANIASRPPQQIAITIFTVDEQLSGWYAKLRKAKKTVDVVDAYRRLRQVIDSLKPLPILDHSLAAHAQYEGLKAMKLGVRKMDLHIAAIVLEANATLVTRNHQDFSRIPGLKFVDWS